MGVVIRVSYTRGAELAEITRLLEPLHLIREISPQKGQYHRAYFKSKDVRDDGRTADNGRTGAIALPADGDR